MRLRWLVVAVLLLGVALNSWPTEEGPVVVHQPISFYDIGISVSPVTYAQRGSIWDSPGCMVGMTFFENRIGVGTHFENRNAANLAGLRIELVEHPEAPRSGESVFRGLFGDTLKVVLDLSAAHESATGSDGVVIARMYPFGELLPLTRDCLLLNAQLESRLHFLDLRIRGVEGFADLEGVYLLADRRKVAGDVSSNGGVPFTDEDLSNCPYLAEWLSIWAPDGEKLAPTSFDRFYVGPLRDAGWRNSIGPGFTVPVEGCVTSPDSAYAIWMSTPGDEPESEVDLVDLRHGRQRMLLASGTPGDYEMAWWLSKDVALVAGGDWDRMAPMLFRIDVSKQTFESYRGPSVPSDRSRQIGEARRSLWHQRFSSQK